MTLNVAVASLDVHCDARAAKLAEQLTLPLVAASDKHHACLLLVTPDRLELRLTTADAPGAVAVDFVGGALAHRREFGGGKGQLVARAVGLKQRSLQVLDITAGLGRDAFVLANLGCQVVMLERSPIIATLLQDGLQRAMQQDWFQTLSLSLVQTASQDYLSQLSAAEYPDVIYCDPMYPSSNKSALVKKEMRVLRQVVGDDVDAADILQLALKKAKYRVVVKRGRLAPTLSELKPDVVFKGKSSRYDVYLIAR